MKHILNDKYFENIDCPEKAYWLGFLYADGYVSLTNPWTVICQIKDIDHLLKLKENLQYSGDLKIQKSTGYNENLNGRLTICRKKMCEDLAEKGCGSSNKKTIVTNFEKAYWRGIFDGDGCISISTRYQTIGNKEYGPYSKYTCYILLQESDINSFEKILNSLQIQYCIQQSACSYMYYVKFSSKKSINTFSNWIYSEEGPYLERKKEIFNKIRSL
jgi:hypothetical protein